MSISCKVSTFSLWLLLLVVILQCSPATSRAVAEEELHRDKRWTRLGKELWDQMPITVNFKEYLPVFTPWQQLKVLHECTQHFTINGKLWFKILQKDAKADVSIYFDHFDGYKRNGQYGIGEEPKPGRTSWIRLEREENWKLRRSSRGTANRGKPVSFKFTLCHELGHTLGLNHSKDKNSLMYAYNTGQSDHKLDQDTKAGLRALYGSKNPQIRG